MSDILVEIKKPSESTDIEKIKIEGSIESERVNVSSFLGSLLYDLGGELIDSSSNDTVDDSIDPLISDSLESSTENKTDLKENKTDIKVRYQPEYLVEDKSNHLVEDKSNHLVEDKSNHLVENKSNHLVEDKSNDLEEDLDSDLESILSEDFISDLFDEDDMQDQTDNVENAMIQEGTDEDPDNVDLEVVEDTFTDNVEIHYPCLILNGATTTEEIDFLNTFKPKNESHNKAIYLYCEAPQGVLDVGYLNFTLEFLLTLSRMPGYKLSIITNENANRQEIDLLDPNQLQRFISF